MMSSVEHRQQTFLRKMAEFDSGELSTVWYGRCTFISLLAAGDIEKANQWMMKKVQECNQRIDCTDFRLNLLIRGMLLFPDRVRPDVKQAIKAAALAARYYGGHCRDYPMFYSSENHHLNWAVAEYLAAQLFPNETFGYDGRTSRQHLDRARFLIANWIDSRSRWGYDEWNSSCYHGINLLSLLNLVDLAAEPIIRQLATDATTKLLADVAADSAYGGVWAAQARLYEPQCFVRSAQNTAPALTILLGAGAVEDLTASQACGDAVATTSYRAPQWLCRLACDLDHPMVNLERHRNDGDIYYKTKSRFWRMPFELTNEAWRQKLCPEDMTDMPIRTERRAEYIVSAAIIGEASKLATAGHQAMIWMSCLNGRVPVFTTQPAPTASGHRAPYWGGTAISPRCYLQDGILAAVYHSKEQDPHSSDFTHAYFPTADFDEWNRQENWFFGRAQDAFVGLLAPPGAALTTQGPWAGKEILAPGRSVAWVAIFGSRAQDGSFASFISRCQAAHIAFDPASATMHVRSGRVDFSVSYPTGAVIAGQPFSCDAWRQLDNPIVQSDFGRPQLHVNAPEGPQTLDFSSARRLAEQWERMD